MKKTINQKTIYKTVDEFVKKYPPPDYVYLIQTNTQIQESNVMDAKPMKIKVDASDTCHAASFTTSSIVQI